MERALSQAIGFLLVVACLCGALSGVVLYWYDRRPIDVPKPYTLHVLWWSHELGLPPSLAAQRDLASRSYRLALQSAQAASQRAARQVAETNARSDAAIKAAQGRIRARTAALHQEIPHALPPAVDVRFALPVGLLRVYDAATLGYQLPQVPYPAGTTDASPSTVTPSAFASVITDNGAECLLDRAELSGLQLWVKTISAIPPPGAGMAP